MLVPMAKTCLQRSHHTALMHSAAAMCRNAFRIKAAL
ncbi:hypothetical protein FJ489_30905 [Mesorhizobium sp. B2-5-12]|nr:hypothetical protein FJ489_30905 [Mesorhizobium sp. B2-5-12]TPK19184.1 hypothetical protein FJ562_31310 [Mesorhizobium sp. B2-5-6]